MSPRDLIESWQREEARPITGWDFSYLAGRMLEEQPPWSYMARAAELMQQSSAVLDIGTGGGERLLALRPSWPASIVVTEAYPPNVKLAGSRLAPFGVPVVHTPTTEVDPLPFAAGGFDLVLNRHSGINCDEVARVLAPGGRFLTQQIHGLWAQDLLAAFDARPPWPDAVPARYASRLRSAGLMIERQEAWQGDLTFKDVGAVVWYLRAVPWLVPGFSVATHTAYLLRLQEEIEEQGELVYEARKYLIEARAPGTERDLGQ